MEEKILTLPEIGEERIDFPHFPTRMQAVIFKNWDIVPKERIAKALRCSVADVEKQAYKMGLAEQKDVSIWLKRGYISIIRANWQILPYDQLLDLLGWTEDKLAFVLKEEDFLSFKLGRKGKNICEPVIYAELTQEQEEQTKLIKDSIQSCFASLDNERTPFDFYQEEKVNVYFADVKDVSVDSVVIDASWYICDNTNDKYVGQMVSRFKRDVLKTWNVSFDGSKPIIINLAKEGYEDEYHELDVNHDKIVITAGTSAGVLRALSYIQDIAQSKGAFCLKKGVTKRTPKLKSRIIYSYSGLYNDSLDVDSRIHCPDELLERYARVGVNGIWIQGILYMLAEFPFAPSLSKGYEKRMEFLKDFVDRAKSYGIKIYFYINEPRAMPVSFYDKHPEIKGHTFDNKMHSLCTSTPEVQKYLYDSIKYICSNVPDVGGFITITRTENQSNCYSHNKVINCPRCSKRKMQEVVSEVVGIYAKAAHEVNPDIKVIAWDWAWRDDKLENFMNPTETKECIELLPKDVILMCNRDRGIKTNVGGIQGEVMDYSISVPGIGPFSEDGWKWAKDSGHETAVKLQMNNSWECSTLPYMPLFRLCENMIRDIKNAGVEHVMLSWTLGGYPSPVIKNVSQLFFETQGPEDKINVLKVLYGKDADTVKKATDIFCDAFMQYPFHITTLYEGPANGGVSNPLYDKPLNNIATMTCYAYDTLDMWRAIYPEDVFENQFKIMTDKWAEGLEAIKDIENKELIAMAVGTYVQLKSSHNQIRFLRARNSGDKKGMHDAAVEERELAAKLHEIMQQYPTVGFEASNHYYYTQNALKEKVLNCDYIIRNYN